MYKSAVNLGAAGTDPVIYMQDGGDPMLVDLQTTGPVSVSEDMPEEAGLGSVFWDKLTGENPMEGVRDSARIAVRGPRLFMVRTRVLWSV